MTEKQRWTELRRELFEAFAGSFLVAFAGAVIVGLYSRREIQRAIGGGLGASAVGLSIVLVVGFVAGAFKAGFVRAAVIAAIVWFLIGFGLVVLLDKGG